MISVLQAHPLPALTTVSAVLASFVAALLGFGSALTIEQARSEPPMA